MKKYLSLATICMLFTLSGYSFTQIVNVNNFVFTPSNFTINLGDTIKWVWSAGSHTTTSLTIPTGAAAWDKQINSSITSFTYVPKKTGTYNYKCSFHFAMGMQGSFTVADCSQPSAHISAASETEFCKGGSVVLNSSVSGSITSYQWIKNGANISNATTASYTAKNNGNYTLKVTNNCGNTAVSNAIKVTVDPLPTATITPSGTVNICTGDSIQLKANTGTSLTYKWQRNGVIIPGATSSKYFAKKAGKYKVIVITATGCSKTSATTTVTINCSNAIAAKLPPDKIQIFPNPSANDFHIAIPAYNSDQFSLLLYDVDGRIVGNKRINSASFSFGSELKPGIYFVEVKRADAVIVKEKIIKK